MNPVKRAPKVNPLKFGDPKEPAMILILLARDLIKV